MQCHSFLGLRGMNDIAFEDLTEEFGKSYKLFLIGKGYSASNTIRIAPSTVIPPSLVLPFSSSSRISPIPWKPAKATCWSWQLTQLVRALLKARFLTLSKKSAAVIKLSSAVLYSDIICSAIGCKGMNASLLVFALFSRMYFLPSAVIPIWCGYRLRKST